MVDQERELSVRSWIAYWQLVSEYGYQPRTTLAERKRIRLTNQSSLVLTFLILLYAIVFGVFGPSTLGWVTLGVAFVFASIPKLHKIYSGAMGVRYFFLLLSYACIFTFSLMVGRDSGIQLFFISAIAAPFLLLDVKRRPLVSLFCMLPLFLLFMLEIHLYESVPPLAFSPRAQRLIYLMMLPSAAITTFLYSAYFHLINQASERELQHTIEDVNRSKKLIEDQQQQLASASRLSAIGELAGSIAHEINNPLSIILGYIELISRMIRADPIDRDRVLQNCDKALKTISRINKIVLGLRKLSREGNDDPMETANLKDIIEDATSVCGESLANLGIELRLKIPEQTCACLCRPLQISQVLLNLIQNAKDAVQELATKWIEIEVKVLESSYVILVKDSGVINDPEILEKIDQPFFTTKPPGKGTGLGLSISRKIMASHGGSIKLVKEASSTTFAMQLPRQAQTS
jgi:signal transduction histidine kinase